MQLSGASAKELVVFNSGSSSGEDLHSASNHIDDQPLPLSCVVPNPSSRVLPSVGAFTVQCASCFKWRLIPSKEKYEQIRESILQRPFVCQRAREWRPDISCDDPPDILQDGSRLWAIDKPNIAQPPPGWDRQLRIRGEGGTRFADVYYVTPSGRKLRSMVEIQRFLEEHPEYGEGGVNASQFSFQIPKPLQDNYVRKRTARLLNSSEGAGLGLPGLPAPVEAFPLSWAAPPIQPEVEPEEPEPTSDLFSPESPPHAKKRVAKEQVRRPSSKKMCASSSSEHSSVKAKFENLQQDRDST
ncbi:Methyl-CpG-binding domain-containing protein 2 [Platanthera guangdongensis]|uniref:Methyl-CpG-binding domain-containing protein 2 n=1 Tax=Platanthera guangdongensis TaxID=2320717 RepID=A0ABR2LWQ9_9ASPA